MARNRRTPPAGKAPAMRLTPGLGKDAVGGAQPSQPAVSPASMPSMDNPPAVPDSVPVASASTAASTAVSVSASSAAKVLVSDVEVQSLVQAVIVDSEADIVKLRVSLPKTHPTDRAFYSAHAEAGSSYEVFMRQRFPAWQRV